MICDPSFGCFRDPESATAGRVAEAPEARPRHDPPRRRPTRILVADDEHFVAAELTFALARAGFIAVGPVSDGAAAVELARRTLPDMALLDIRMPKMDGLQTARELTETLHIPCIIVSAYSEEEYVQTASDIGVFGYLVKPVADDQLRACIELSWERFCRYTVDRVENRSLRQRLEERKVIEQAKWLVVSTRGMSEPDALHLLQKRARQTRR